MEVNKYTLDNGLRLVHVYDPDTVMVAVNVLYDVGARDERPELTGMAHLFEHLMFGPISTGGCRPPGDTPTPGPRRILPTFTTCFRR